MLTVIRDKEILWIPVQLSGNPPKWSPNTKYELGDSVVPQVPTVDQANLMFQCVGFVGNSGAVAPTFNPIIGHSVDDNECEWTTVDPEQNPPELPYDQYYLITPTVNVSS